MLCMLSIACPNVYIDETFFPRFHSDLIWIRTLTTFFIFFFKGERIQISLKAGQHRPASETPLNGVSLACPWWPNVECWLGSFESFRGSGPVLLRNSPLWICAWDRTMYTLKTHFIVRMGFCTTLCVLSIAREHIFLIDETFFPEFHSGLIWIQTVFANVNGERKRERLVHAHRFGKI